MQPAAAAHQSSASAAKIHTQISQIIETTIRYQYIENLTDWLNHLSGNIQDGQSPVLVKFRLVQVFWQEALLNH